jgi:hypothetical protein
MSTESTTGIAADNSWEFFTDPSSYEGVGSTQDFKRIITCIDPRLPGCVDSKEPVLPHDLKTTINTAGGGIGLAHDRVLRLTIEQGEVVPIEVGLSDEKRFRVSNVLDAHRECKFLNGIVVVLEEEAAPGDFTMDAIERWDRLYGLDLVGSDIFDDLKDAAARQAEAERNRQDAESLLDVVDSLYPQHPNVRYMAGENRARLHVTNHHPFIGVNRQKQAQRYGETAQAYHDNLAAIVERSSVLPDLSRQGRMLRAGAALMRAAATRTVVTLGHPDTRFLEVFADNSEAGLRFEEQQAA